MIRVRPFRVRCGVSAKPSVITRSGRQYYEIYGDCPSSSSSCHAAGGISRSCVRVKRAPGRSARAFSPLSEINKHASGTIVTPHSGV